MCSGQCLASVQNVAEEKQGDRKEGGKKEEEPYTKCA